MIRRLKRLVVTLLQWVSNGFGKTFIGWLLLTLYQLRFKFSALREGISENKRRRDSLFNLRRNIHRLEKGLIYENPKPVFAEDYILATVRALALGKDRGSLDENTIRWGESVLRKYFSTVSDTQVTREAQEVFEKIPAEFPEGNWFPYPNSARAASGVSFEDIYQLSLRRRSVRYFEKRPVPRSVVEQAVAVAAQSPSACNRQSFQYLFFNDPAVAQRLSDVPGGVKGYELENIIVVLGRYSGYFNVRDINAPVIDASLANMSLLYALETLGVSTVCINWPNLPDREKKIRKILDIEPDEFIIMLIGLGYPKEKGKIPYSGKRPVSELLSVNERLK